MESRVKRPCAASWAALTSRVADGRHELGHMYFLMKSCALGDRRLAVGYPQRESHSLVSGIPCFRECRRSDHSRCAVRFEGPVHDAEVCVVVLLRAQSSEPRHPVLVE